MTIQAETSRSHLQYLYSRVRRHLLTQGKQARAVIARFDSDNECVYRSPDGLMCAVGCLIPPDKYDPSFEGSGLGTNVLLRTFLKEEGIASTDDELHLLGRLQALHDSYSVEAWHCRLDELAKDFKLEVES